MVHYGSALPKKQLPFRDLIKPGLIQPLLMRPVKGRAYCQHGDCPKIRSMVILDVQKRFSVSENLEIAYVLEVPDWNHGDQ